MLNSEFRRLKSRTGTESLGVVAMQLDSCSLQLDSFVNDETGSDSKSVGVGTHSHYFLQFSRFPSSQ